MMGWMGLGAAGIGSRMFGGINEIRNNSMSGAVNGSPGTLPTNWTVTSPTGLTRTITVGTQVDGPYTVNTIDLNFVGTASSTATISISFESTTQIAAITGQVWTGSLWVSVPVDHAALTALPLNLIERTSGGALVLSTAAVNTYAGRATFQRRNGTVTLSGGGTTAFLLPRLDTNSIASGTDLTAGLTIRVGWPQAERSATVGLPKRTPT